MSDYFKIFETEDLYNSFRRTVDESTTPNVSLVTETDKVWYNRDDEWYYRQYLTFVALEDGTFKFTMDADQYGGTLDITSISYSTDDGETWVTTTRNSSSLTVITTPTITAGNRVLWKGIGNNLYDPSGPGLKSKFSSTCNFEVYGNVNSLLYGDNFYNNKTSKTFSYLFYYCTKLISAEKLILPATAILEDYCYSYMFGDCTSLTTAPELPATTLAYGCYNNMFNHCTSLTTAPKLPATTLAQSCYSYMFYGCTGLTTAPVLSATMLTQNCYGGMFADCTSLTTAPSVLPATTLTDYCYYYMFKGCTSLTTAPELPATSLTYQCYQLMFLGCTSLTTAPELPATTLAQSCYNYMFNGCTNLNYIKAMFTTTPSTTYTMDWVKGVASSGTFVKNSTATWTSSCGNNTYPCNWTVETASE